MTSRLKRRLNDLGVDTASSKATENFCLIGTPLPPLEKSRDIGEFVPLWKQEVRDEKGRRRLHGAFTGGFSAGYFNTVGSKEGWTPATFASSRTDRAKKKAARPEDFMDEEDLAELRDSQKLVDTTEEMDIDFWDRGRKKDAGGDEKDSITSALETTLLPAPRDSVGAQILKKMGWRPGHGIGPRITYEQRKRQDALSHVVSESRDDLEGNEDHEEAKKHLYPRRDTKLSVIKRKDDKHGLGYDPGMGLMDILAVDASGGGGNKAGKEPNISTGFGLGALNEADEDDLDVYDSGPGRGTRRLAYDGNDDDERVVMGSRNKSLRGDKPASLQATHLSKQTSEQRKTMFNNGTLCLPGFMVAENPVVEDKWFHPPVVPKGWTPNPRRVWEQDKENLEAKDKNKNKSELPKDGRGWRRGLTHDQRGNLLGETPLPAAPRSVFDYLAPKDRDRLQNLAVGQAPSGVPVSAEPGPTSVPPEPESTIPRLDSQVAKMALQGFQPFTSDPVKQARYTAFLQAQAAGADSVPFARAPGQNVDAFTRELQDYVRSAQIFKPVSGAMAGRFTRAAVLDTGPKALEGLHGPVEEGSVPRQEAEEEKAEREESPKENAARLGMYGPLTREAKPWIPARLLCKRFGVKEPNVELPTETASASASGAGNWQSGGVLTIMDAPDPGSSDSTQIRGDGDGLESSLGTGSGGGKGRRGRDVANVGLGEDETQGRDILTYERPSMDIFKAIFASDDEDEDEREGGAGDEGEDDVEPRPGGSPQENNLAVAKVDEAESSKTLTEPSASTAAYEPAATHVDYNNAAGKVDMVSFKPTFVPRSERQKTKDKEKKEIGKDREDKGKDKDRERKKKKGKAVLVSFEVDEEGDETRSRDRSQGREKKRKKRKEERVEAKDRDDEDMWVEKPPPEAVQNLPVSTPAPPYSNTSNYSTPHAAAETEAGPPKGRKRAIDFM